jgi:hypothetical protein
MSGDESGRQVCAAIAEGGRRRLSTPLEQHSVAPASCIRHCGMAVSNGITVLDRYASGAIGVVRDRNDSLADWVFRLTEGALLLASVRQAYPGFAAPVAVLFPGAIIRTSWPCRSASEAAATAASNADSLVW